MLPYSLYLITAVHAIFTLSIQIVLAEKQSVIINIVYWACSEIRRGGMLSNLQLLLTCIDRAEEHQYISAVYHWAKHNSHTLPVKSEGSPILRRDSTEQFLIGKKTS